MRDSIPISGTSKTGANLLAVLKAFGRQDRWGATSLAEELGLTKTATHRLLKTLAAAGFVSQAQERGEYTLGPEFIALARKAAARTTVGSVSHPHLVRLAEATGEMASLDVLSGHRYVCVDMVDVHHHVATTVRIGDTVGLHAGAGKVILAYQHRALIDAVLEDPLIRYTDNTPCDPDVVRAYLEQIRRDGRWVSEGEVTPGTRGLAMPIFGTGGQVESALTITSVRSRIPDSRIDELFALMRAACDEIGATLGHTPEVGLHPGNQSS